MAWSYIDPKGNLNWIDTSKVTSLFHIFYNTAFDGDISEWNVSNVTNMCGTFMNSKYTGTNGDINNWDVSRVVNMDSLFNNSAYCGDLSKWNVSKVKKLGATFANTSTYQFSKLLKGISHWNLSANVNMINCFLYNKLSTRYSYNSNMITLDADFIQWLSKLNCTTTTIFTGREVYIMLGKNRYKITSI